jgi:threonine synthase
LTEQRLYCRQCGATAPLTQFVECVRCGGGLLELTVPIKAVHLQLMSRPTSIWHYAELLPEVPPHCRLSLGESGSPLVETRVAGRQLLVKNEGVNPTLSFKDRFSAVNVSVAKSLGYTRVVLSSTGNAGLAAAAYAARGSMEARVFCPPETPGDIQRAIRALGADLQVRERVDHAELVMQSIENGFFPGSRSFPFRGVTPYGVEGYKTIAYEIAAALGQAPDTVFMPLGGGDGAYGVYKGFVELRELDLTDRLPQLIAVGSSATIASSIASDVPGAHALSAVELSGGKRLSVDQAEIRSAMRALANAGLLVEPASSASVAGFMQEAAGGFATADGICVCVVTGSLAKWWDRIQEGLL